MQERPVGLSTGALLRGDFRGALSLLSSARPQAAVELSALRRGELPALRAALSGHGAPLDLSGFRYVSLHAPSRYEEPEEDDLSAQLADLSPPLPIVLHPDAIFRTERWERLGARLLIENMDLRKRTGQTVAQLEAVFDKLPEAGLCFDLGHAYQVDPTLALARAMLTRFGARLRQLHLSEIDAAGRHLPLRPATVAAFQSLSELIPPAVPVIIEAQISAAEIDQEIERARAALG